MLNNRQSAAKIKENKMDFQEKIKKVFKENDITILFFEDKKGYIKYQCNCCKRVYENKNATSLLSKISLCEKCWKPFSRWNKKRLQFYKLDRLFPQSKLTFIEFNGTKKAGKIRCNKCGYIKVYSNLSAVLRRTEDYFCEKCENTKNKTYNYTIKNLPETIELIQWNGAKEKSEFYCKKCNKNFFRRARINSNLNYCPNCSEGNNKYTLLEAQEKFNKDFGDSYKILRYEGQKGRSLLQHTCGFCFSCNLGDFKKSKGCPKCFKKISKLEQKVLKFLKENNYDYEYQKRFGDFKKYPFDFYVKIKNREFLIETQGRQHYQNVPIFDSYELQQQRDLKKKEYCLTNNIPLIEIPYWEEENLPEYLLDMFNDYLEKE